MKCPFCGYDKNTVVDVRQREGNTTRRRRMCEKCGERYTTLEKIYSFQDGSARKVKKRVKLAAGEDSREEFVLLIRNRATRKEENREQSDSDGTTHA